MEQKFGVTHLLAILLVIVGVFFLIAGPSFSPTRQVSNGAASTLDLSGDEEISVLGLFELRGTGALVVFGVVILGGIVFVGVGLGAGFWLLTRQVTRAKDAADEPADPLDYRTYGQPMAVVLVGGLFTVVALFFLVVDILPVQASTQAETVDLFFMIEFLTIAFIFGLVVGLLIHILFFYNARGDMSDGTHFHGNIPLELFWTITPLIFVMVLGVFAMNALIDITEEKEGEVGIYVEGFQWGWRFYYPTELFFSEEELAEMDPEQLDIIRNTEANVRARSGFEGYGIQTSEMVMLIEQPVRVDMTSTDVLHNFWVPEFRIKRDAVPGVITDLRYTPILDGTYKVRCAELCGTLHYAMLADVRVVTEGDYEAWIDTVKLSFSNPVEAGRVIYEGNCATCHSIDGSDGTGPTWLNRVGTEAAMSDGSQAFADYQYVFESVWSPNARIVSGYSAGVMPQNYSEIFSEGQVGQIFAFMCSVSDAWEQTDDCLEYEQYIREARGETAETEVAASTNGMQE